MEEIKVLDVGVRGTIFTVFGEWLKGKLGEDKLNRFKGLLQAETAELLSRASRVKRYPLEKLLDILEVSEEKLAISAWDEFGVYLCEHSLSTRFSDLAAYLDPETFIRRIPLFWSRYFDAGKMRVAELSDDRAQLKLDEPFGDERIVLIFNGWFRQALSMMRASEINVESEGFSWSLSWRWDK
ncbi:hypothetical protein GF359_01490 [candidate division WOR-3 bacterium]|uniref:Uncharacterized protein n=1 Tax=candidate division WOR-3 bacterium TaxID=2052148 RepID=A0A9D5QBR2_UNCW3|nr:hypothetical protein [candidate division WOR-3 bacterium]MBD3363868.1 hypothetical protein [candidate division WOR-3 bacterium]